MRLSHRSIRRAPHLLIEEAEVSGLAPDSQRHVKYCFCIMNTLYTMSMLVILMQVQENMWN